MVVQSSSLLSEGLVNYNMESKKYIVVKNHVRELTNKNIEEIIEETSKKSEKKSKKRVEKEQSTSDDSEPNNEISKNDLKDLKSVYKKCKAVLMHIESKYGHLLNLDGENSRKRKQQDSDEECNCKLNKKIVFIDNGEQILEEGIIENHICPKKLRSDRKYFPEKTHNIQIEEDLVHNLPDNIQELSEILKDSISDSLRYSVINKIKNIRNENLNMIRYDRSTLIEKLKSNPEEVMDFKGTNISRIVGYPTE